jgi:hypothetical protein
MEVEINDSELEMTTSVRERDSLIESALFQNRLAAVAVSLLLHWTPSTTTTTTTTTKSEAPSVTLEETTLYHTLAHLSYLGDVRVGVAEDPHKVTRIVTANLSAFQEIYRPILTRLHQRGLLVLHSHSSTWHITLSVHIFSSSLSLSLVVCLSSRRDCGFREELKSVVYSSKSLYQKGFSWQR